jgi:hypothetical protein
MVPASLPFLLLLVPLSVLALHQPEEPPVCQATDQDDCEDTCGLWFAKSTFNPNEFGLYAGKARSANQHVGEPDILSKCLHAVFLAFEFLVVLKFPLASSSSHDIVYMFSFLKQYHSTTPT